MQAEDTRLGVSLIVAGEKQHNCSNIQPFDLVWHNTTTRARAFDCPSPRDYLEAAARSGSANNVPRFAVL